MKPFLPRIRQLAPFVLVLISAMVAVGAYLQALNYPFIGDDDVYITENTELAGLHLTGLWRLFVGPYNTYAEFLPLRDFSYWLDMKLFGLNPSAFRMHNILLYLLCLPLVYATTSGIWRYFRPADAASARWAAAAVTALFALHPTLVEAVVWISGRKYVLPNLFSMLAFWFAVNSRREHGLSPIYAAATLVTFVAVMLSKTTYAPVALVITALWVIFWLDTPAPGRHRSLLLWPFFILLLGAVLTLAFIASGGGLGVMEKVPFYFGIEAITRTLAVLGWLARLAVSPESRHFFYPVFEDPFLPAMVALGAAVLLAAMWGMAMALRQRSLEGFALAVFFLLCLSYLQLMPYAPPSLVSDRFLALAAWPAVLLIVALAWRLKPLPRTALLFLIALSWVFQTAERPRGWRSLEVLTNTDWRAYPGYYFPAAYEINNIYLKRGLYREANELSNKITDPEARNITMKLIQADYAVNVSAVSTGRPQEAMALLWNLGVLLRQPPAQAKWNTTMVSFWLKSRHLLAARWDYLAKHFPDDESVRYNTGLWMLNNHHYKDAVSHLRAATESQRLPESMQGTALKNLGLALLNSGHSAEAEIPLRAALEQSHPDVRAQCLLSEVYKQTKRLEESVRAKAGCPILAPSEETEQ